MNRESIPSQRSLRETVESWAHFKLPDRSAVSNVHTEQGIDAAIWAKLTIPEESKAEFLRATGFTGQLSTTDRPLRTLLLSQEPWWRPDELTPFQSGNAIREEGQRRFGISLLMGRTGDQAWTVYLFVTSL